MQYPYWINYDMKSEILGTCAVPCLEGSIHIPSAIVFQPATPIDERKALNKGICYENMDFRSAGSRAINKESFCFDRRGGYADRNFEDYEF